MLNRIAVYLRLSMEDGGEKDESSSISGQRKQILDYIHKDDVLCGYETAEYCDDGYSGTGMDRPGLKKMLEDVKKNKIQCIIVKDMSRFSRDYIELGTYLNHVFPFMGVRFIALGDNYDSRRHKGNIIELDTAFKTLLYDLYSKDISVKVRTSLESKCANGEYVFGNVPFGYEKSRNEKNAVVVNESEAEVVRHIFSLALKGKSSTEIARQLYEEKIPTITQLRNTKVYGDGRVQTWSNESVRRILNNRFYLGEMNYGKTTRQYVGSKNRKKIPPDEWKVIPNHHEPLVAPEIFEKVFFSKTSCSANNKRGRNPLSGKLFCGGCGYSMSYKTIKKNENYHYFWCRKHSVLDLRECCVYFKEDVLEKLILRMINKELRICGETVRHEVTNILSENSHSFICIKKINDLKSQQKKLQILKDDLYEKYADGNITIEEYREKADRLTEHTEFLSVQIISMQEEYQKNYDNIKRLLQEFHIEKLTKETVNVFISKIYVYNDKRVEIEWNFSDGYKETFANKT